MHAVTEVARRGYRSYRWLWVVMGVLGPQPRPCARVRSVSGEPWLQPRECIEWYAQHVHTTRLDADGLALRPDWEGLLGIWQFSQWVNRMCRMKGSPPRSEILLMHNIKSCHFQNLFQKLKSQRANQQVCFGSLSVRTEVPVLVLLLPPGYTKHQGASAHSAGISNTSFLVVKPKKSGCLHGLLHVRFLDVSSALVMAINGGLSFTVSSVYIGKGDRLLFNVIFKSTQPL